MSTEKEYQFTFNGNIGGYGIVSAKNEEEARKKILKQEYDDVMDTWDMDITEVVEIKEI